MAIDTSDAYGFYDNEAEKWVFNEAYMQIPWFVDTEGQLYIIPESGADFAPDNGCTEDLHMLMVDYKGEALVEMVESVLPELELVPQSLRRISAETGPYTA
ncbi:hypothetical protein [Neptuniibacter sp. QD37_11]|uniref:hypothetical protein n=1 Tax=Neptuniibacter sp. QD37_11 TaxID=3398209 RepID=UPI0039F45437